MKGFAKNDPNINRRGRPPKALNRISRPLKARISEFLDERFDEMPAIWSKLPPRERVRLFIDLLPFCIAKMTNVDLDMNFTQLSDVDLDRIIDNLLNKQNE